MPKSGLDEKVTIRIKEFVAEILMPIILVVLRIKQQPPHTVPELLSILRGTFCLSRSWDEGLRSVFGGCSEHRPGGSGEELGRSCGGAPSEPPERHLVRLTCILLTSSVFKGGYFNVTRPLFREAALPKLPKAREAEPAMTRF